ALAVAGGAHSLGMPVADVAARLTAAEARSRWRMEITERADGVTVVNDAYNANPEATRAAPKTLAVRGGDRRAGAVLGELLELGESSTAEHGAVGRQAAQLGIARVVAVGAGAASIHQAARREPAWVGESAAVPDTDAAFELLRRELRAGDVVLLKSSRDAGLRHLGDRLAEAGGAS